MLPAPTEAQTRKQIMDPALERAGCGLGNPDLIREQIPVDSFDAAAWHALDAELRKLRDAGVPEVLIDLGFLHVGAMSDQGEHSTSAKAWKHCAKEECRGIVPQAAWAGCLRVQGVALRPLPRSIEWIRT